MERPPPCASRSRVWVLLALTTTLLAVAGIAAAAAAARGAAAARASAAASGQAGGLPAAKAEFLRQYGAEYGYGGWLDAHWQAQVGYRFGPHMRHYLDFTGAALYTASHLAAASDLLSQTTLSNPHSRNPSSLAAEAALQEARQRVLRFFNASEHEWTVVWTSGATAALKLVGEGFPWASPPGWRPPRATPAGGVSDSSVGRVTTCGAFPRDGGAGGGADGAAAEEEAAAGGPSPAPTSHFVYLRSNHKSVLGIGGYARARGARLVCVDEQGMNDWLQQPSSSSSRSDEGSSSGAAGAEHGGGSSSGAAGDVAASRRALLSAARPQAAAEAAAAGPDSAVPTLSLVAAPSKDNYLGKLYPYQQWVEKVHAKSTPAHRWLFVLDAAAHVPTHGLDLSVVKPDFVPVSFYKLFGFPTGLGVLLARRESLQLLHKVYFGGGAVVDATAEDIWRVLMPPPDGYEDGTQSFLSIAQLRFGFDQLQALGGISAVERHVRSLQAWLHAELAGLRHANGAPLVRLFGQHELGPEHQSCIFQMLVLRPDGAVVSPVAVEEAAVAAGIGLRTGCMCNPSQCLHELGIRPEEHRAAILNDTDVSSGFLTVLRPVGPGGALAPVELPVGSVRVSLGYLSTFEDVWAFVGLLRDAYRDAPAAQAGGGGGGEREGPRLRRPVRRFSDC